MPIIVTTFSSVTYPRLFFATMLFATVSMNLNGFQERVEFNDQIVLRIFVMGVLFHPDETTLGALAPFFAGNISAPVIHRIGTAKDHTQALYWVRKLTVRMCNLVMLIVRRNVLGPSLGESDRSI